MLNNLGKRVCAFQQELSCHQSEAGDMEESGHTRQRRFDRTGLPLCFVAPKKAKCRPRQNEVKPENATRIEVSEKQGLRGQREALQRWSSKNGLMRSQQERDQANECKLQGTGNHTSRYLKTERAGPAVRRRHAALKLVELLETVAGPNKWTWLYQGKTSSSQVAACPPGKTWGRSV